MAARVATARQGRLGKPAPSTADSVRSALLDRLAADEDPVVAYRAGRLIDDTAADAESLADLRSRIPESAIARALLRGRDGGDELLAHAYRKWQGPHWTLTCLALIEYPPGDETLQPLVAQVHKWLFSKHQLSPPATAMLLGQEDRVRHCASQEGNAIWSSVRLGLENERTVELVDRLVGCQWPDGGWNCDKRPEARASSFVETAIPARGLRAFGRRHAYEPAIRAADRAAELMLSRRLLWRRRDGALLDLSWGGHVERIHFPIQFYDVLFALQVMVELGRIGDPRCDDALAMLESKRLPDGGFPLEARNAITADRVVSRGSFAHWGPAGRLHSNQLVSLMAFEVLKAAERARSPSA